MNRILLCRLATGLIVSVVPVTAAPTRVGFIEDHPLVKQFGAPKLQRSELLETIRKYITAEPEDPHLPKLKQLAAGLESLVLEEKDHPLLTDEALAKLVPADKAKELVRRLRDETFTNDITQPAPPVSTTVQQLTAMEFAAAPALIAALDDHRPTRYYWWSEVSYDRQVPYLSSIAEKAYGLLIPLFGTPNVPAGGDHSVFTPSPANASEWKQAYEKIWAEYEKKGQRQFLIDRVSLRQEGWPTSVAWLDKKFPDEMSDALLKAYAIPGPDAQRAMLYADYFMKYPAWKKLCIREVTEGSNLMVRLAAATQLRRAGKDTEAVAEEAMANQWEQFLGKADEDYLQFLIEFLAESKDRKIIERLTTQLSERSVAQRRLVVNRLAQAYDRIMQQAKYGQKVDTVWLDLLEDKIAACLSDDEEDWGHRERYNMTHSNPAEYLAALLPNRYKFDPAAPFQEQEATRQDCLNRWRKARQMPLSAAPALEKVSSAQRNLIKGIKFSDDRLNGTATEKELKALKGQQLRGNDLVRIICAFYRTPPPGVTSLQIRAVRSAKLYGAELTIWTNRQQPYNQYVSFAHCSPPYEAPENSVSVPENLVNLDPDLGRPLFWKDWAKMFDQQLSKPNTEFIGRIGVWTINKAPPVK